MFIVRMYENNVLVVSLPPRGQLTTNILRVVLSVYKHLVPTEPLPSLQRSSRGVDP